MEEMELRNVGLKTRRGRNCFFMEFFNVPLRQTL